MITIRTVLDRLNASYLFIATLFMPVITSFGANWVKYT